MKDGEGDILEKGELFLERPAAVYICDDNYVWITCVSMVSLLEHNKGMKVYVLGSHICPKNKRLLAQIADAHCGVCKVLDLPEGFCTNQLKNQRWPVFTLARLFLGDLMPPQMSRVLYLDSDTLITGSVAPLWTFEMGEMLYYGVKDCVSGWYKRNIGLPKNALYLNGGVLLANLEALRRESIKSEINSFFEKYGRALSYFDQDILNAVFRGKIGVLPPEYNVMSSMLDIDYDELQILRQPLLYYSRQEIRRAIQQPRIVHFSRHILSTQPWESHSCNPYREAFLHYAGMTPWKEQIPYQAASPFKIILIDAVRYSPSIVRKVLLATMGYWHAVWRPQLRYWKSLKYKRL